MAHCRLLFVGGRANLDQIFANCQDSSSETSAEMTISADWIADYDLDDEEERKLGWTTDNFTKKDKKLYQEVLDGKWYDCYDIRDVERYGSFDCLNCPDFEPYADGSNLSEKEERNRARVIEAIKRLPDDTLFHFADSHW